MNRTLSVLVPVLNVQATIGRTLGQLLEILPELTAKFEVAIIDQGSTDDTPEMAHELSLAYPQISVLSLPRTADLTSVLRRGLSHTAGDYVLLREPDCRGDLDELPKLWALGRTHDLVVGIVKPAIAQAPPLAAPGSQPRPLASRLRLVQRRVTWAWISSETDEPLDAYLARKRYRVCEVPVRECRAAAHSAQSFGRRLVEVMGKPGRLDPANVGPRAAVAVKRPAYLSYLSRFKTFALGE